MIDYTANIKNKMHTSDDSFERLQMIKNKYLNKTAYIVSAGPSLKNYNIDKLKLFLKDKFVIAVKQVYDLLQEVVDIHVLNFDNYKLQNYLCQTIQQTYNHYQQDLLLKMQQCLH